MNQPVAIITGAGSGIGRAAAIELARRGFRLSLAGRQSASLKETATLAGGAEVIQTDITDPAQVDRLILHTHDRFGRVDALVHSAGIAPVLSIEQTSIEHWHQILNTNLSSIFYLTRAAWPIFRKQNDGVVVNISSLASRDPFPGFAAYAAAKAGVNLLSLSLAREGAPLGIRVFAIAPGAVETAMFRKIRTVEQVPTSQTLDPAEVATVIAQCIAGDPRYVSGEVIWLQRTPT